jgi:cyanophycinase-like exopeptidase
MRSTRAVRWIGPVSFALVSFAGCASVSTHSETSAAPRGRLLIVGGGPVPAAVYRRFVERAGGQGRGRIAIFPTASRSEDAGIEPASDLEKLGARAERIVLTREEAEGGVIAGRLDGVTGIWFGGDQTRLTAAIGGTPVEAAIWARPSPADGPLGSAEVTMHVLPPGSRYHPESGQARLPSEAGD